MFYASLYIVFYFCVCESVLSMFYANLFVVFFSFLLCLWLSLAIFLCHFFSCACFPLCLCVGFANALRLIKCVGFFFFLFIFLQRWLCFSNILCPFSMFFFSFILRMWLVLANVLCLFMCIFFFSFLLCLCLCFVNAL